MLPELTPDQRAKLARGWVWQEGHLPEGSKSRVSGYLAPRELTPDINDPVTRDGLLRTARAITGIPSLVAVMVGPGRDGRARWALQRMVWDHGAEYQLLTATRWGGLGIPMMWESEPAALLAAILAAPEAA